MSSRHRPLLACTMSILAMAEITARKAPDLNEPFRTTAKLAKLVMTPLIYAMKYQWSFIIFFLHYQFLAILKTMALFCPSASRVFDDKIEELVLVIESLRVINELPEIIYQFSFLIKQRSLVYLISLLNCLIIKLNQMHGENSMMKEIAIDTPNNNNLQLPPESSDSLYTNESFFSATQCFPADESYNDIGKILDQIDNEGASERGG